MTSFTSLRKPAVTKQPYSLQHIAGIVAMLECSSCWQIHIHICICICICISSGFVGTAAVPVHFLSRSDPRLELRNRGGLITEDYQLKLWATNRSCHNTLHFNNIKRKWLGYWLGCLGFESRWRQRNFPLDFKVQKGSWPHLASYPTGVNRPSSEVYR